MMAPSDRAAERKPVLNRLVYFSEREARCGDEALRRLVARSALRNQERCITGLLIADRTCFIQILEGPRTPVSLLFQAISRDRRHRNVVLVEMTEIASYSYPQWGLAQCSDPQVLQAAWRRVSRDEVWAPWPLDALQLRAFLRIAVGAAERPTEEEREAASVHRLRPRVSRPRRRAQEDSDALPETPETSAA
ncbi:MAG: hypothetical protein GC206_12805 [Alphaproteobacteria bacterium]|nr:hypothetical protein [Alphaproteobacteria bacterium]